MLRDFRKMCFYTPKIVRKMCKSYIEKNGKRCFKVQRKIGNITIDHHVWKSEVYDLAYSPLCNKGLFLI